MIDPGTIIDGRYRVVSRLGSGGMADVYLAQDQLLGRDVAVKVLHHHFAEDQEFVERFRREASSAAALSHPNIVAIFDRGEWNGTYYIAMEYVAGRSLKELVREQGALDPATAIEIVVQILRAARFAHRRGVIHRDLKPHNVILDEEGRARVTDFGIARAGASDMTLTGSIMGTAQYLSPEQAQGLVVSAASDLYSIGVILYELLTGAVPFEGETAVAIAFKQVSAEPYPPSALNPALPPSLDAVVLRALAKDPAHRYADADELIAALERERQLLPALSGATAVVPDGHLQHAHQPPPRAGVGSLLLAQPGTGQYELEGGAPAEERRRPGWQRALLWALAIVLDRRRRRGGGAAAGSTGQVGDRAERHRPERTGRRGQAARRRPEPRTIACSQRERLKRPRDPPDAGRGERREEGLGCRHRRLGGPRQRAADGRHRPHSRTGRGAAAQGSLEDEDQDGSLEDGRSGARDRHRAARRNGGRRKAA